MLAQNIVQHLSCECSKPDKLDQLILQIGICERYANSAISAQQILRKFCHLNASFVTGTGIQSRNLLTVTSLMFFVSMSGYGQTRIKRQTDKQIKKQINFYSFSVWAQCFID